jgi:hypothetical protein
LNHEDFDDETALMAAQALQTVLSRRTHRKKVLGEECIVPGQLGEALGLPRLCKQLKSRRHRVRQDAVERFDAIWSSLSESSRRKVRQALGWYDPRELDWEDPRSNRRPVERY